MNEKLDFEEAKTVFLHNLDLLIFTNIVSEDLNASFIARKFCMSLSTLYRRMLRYAGCGVNEYIRNKRLDKAMSLLTNVYGGGNLFQLAMLLIRVDSLLRPRFQKLFAIDMAFQ